ncbi:MAG: hypothetical protein WC740_00845 [Verrucomicrobiia bacterium]
MKQVKIYCPKCQWVPDASARWLCEPSCGCSWNTFETCGVCPRCGRNWEDTQCLTCHRWSSHADWYHEFIPDEQRQMPKTELAGATG